MPFQETLPLRTVSCPYLESAVSVSSGFSLSRNLSLAERSWCFPHWFFRLLKVKRRELAFKLTNVFHFPVCLHELYTPAADRSSLRIFAFFLRS